MRPALHFLAWLAVGVALTWVAVQALGAFLAMPT